MMTREIAFAPSSHIQAISYDDETMTLTVAFKKSTYAYKGVPEDVAVGFENTISAGNYLNNFIKSQYEFERIA